MEKNNEPKILAIETSCDETAAAVLIGAKIKSNIIYSQLNLHKKTKGIVPEVASRAHIEKIILVIKQALQAARVRPLQIDLIAVTVGPGLIGSLLVGVDTAKTLGFIWDKSIVPVNHIEGHIYANFIGKLPATSYKLPTFPAVALVVSGGHTSLILMRGHGNYKLLGSTLDDAAGEAFDKVARILDLGYPGGPAISAAAESCQQTAAGCQLSLPRPMIKTNNFDFSFSGLKTAVLYTVQDLKKHYKVTQLPNYTITAVAAEFQQAVVDVLVNKTIKAARKYNAKSILLGGGVAANKLLRRQLRSAVKKELPVSCFLFPALSLCTDNAAMIGLCAYYKYLADKKNLKNWREIKIDLNPKL
ncbi:tRNA (adenosine(37)-N6)-threonylcarbamoyltransferase complex transferase subunit TsaD [Patescibacteria group bacterium]|nr:tRNA (adenosine(37)-N6)-threonylcarbamoyltransferase complex transferase subunit TsaD [Patescibacteria group bacterium]